jgi:hypothetical protein
MPKSNSHGTQELFDSARNGKNAKSPKSMEKSDGSALELGRQCRSWGQKYQSNTVCNCDTTTDFLGLQCQISGGRTVSDEDG